VISYRVVSAGIGWIDAAVTAAVSAVIFALVIGLVDTGFPHGNLADAVLAVTMTLPLAWARRAPTGAAVASSTADVLNWLVAGSMVRCAASLAVTFWIACVIGAKLPGRVAGRALLVVLIGVAAQCVSDPNLIWPTPVVLVPVTFGFFLGGRVLRSRALALRGLRERNQQISTQRDRTAELAVEAERDRIALGVEQAIQVRIDKIDLLARAGRDAVADEPGRARQAFVEIADEGRETLARMRAVVGSLHDRVPIHPQPGLDDLDRLLAAHAHPVQLSVRGDSRSLSEAVGLAGYRVVEQFLGLVTGAGDASVRITYQPEAVDLHIVAAAPGSAQDVVGQASAQVLAARERLALIGGSLLASAQAGRIEWRATLPTGSVPP
jgi:hypothetical protein